MEQWISLRAYARHRKVALSAVQKAIETGRVTAVRRRDNGRIKAIELVAADEQWARNTDPLEAARNGKLTGPVPGQHTPPPIGAEAIPADAGAGAPQSSGARSAPEADTPGALRTLPGLDFAAPSETAAPAASPTANTDQADYLAARAKKEGFLAKQEELNYLEKIGMLVSAAAVESEIAEIFGLVKNHVMRVADRKAQILAAELDPTRVHRLLSEEFRTVFNELSGRLTADASIAPGLEEPATALP